LNRRHQHRFFSCSYCWCRPQDNRQYVLCCLLCFRFWLIVVEEEVVYGRRRRPCSLSLFLGYERKVGVLAAILWPWFLKVFYRRRDELLINRSIEPSASASVLLLRLLSVSAAGQSMRHPLLSPLFSFWVDCCGGGGCLRSAVSLFSFFIFGIRKKGWHVGCHPLALVFEGFLWPSR